MNLLLKKWEIGDKTVEVSFSCEHTNKDGEVISKSELDEVYQWLREYLYKNNLVDPDYIYTILTGIVGQLSDGNISIDNVNVI